jgi:hypothetical protein
VHNNVNNKPHLPESTLAIIITGKSAAQLQKAVINISIEEAWAEVFRERRTRKHYYSFQ